MFLPGRGHCGRRLSDLTLVIPAEAEIVYMFLIEGMIPGSLTGSRNFALSLCFLFSQAVFQITFLSAVATLLQLHSDENNPGQDHVAIRINQSCLDPIGSFPFGITATAVGAPWTVAVCGALTVASLAYVVLFDSSLRRSKPIGET